VLGIVGSTGPIVGALTLDWRWMFLVNVPIAIVAFKLSLRFLPADPPQDTHTRLDVMGVALIGPGVAAGVLALSEAGQQTAVVLSHVE
jgi:predicted MFS family arabinose efflux permease